MSGTLPDLCQPVADANSKIDKEKDFTAVVMRSCYGNRNCDFHRNYDCDHCSILKISYTCYNSKISTFDIIVYQHSLISYIKASINGMEQTNLVMY